MDPARLIPVPDALSVPMEDEMHHPGILESPVAGRRAWTPDPGKNP